MHVDHVRDLRETVDDPAQLRHIGYLGGETHTRAIPLAVRLGIYPQHVDLGIGKHRGDVSQQPFPVTRQDVDVSKSCTLRLSISTMESWRCFASSPCSLWIVP